MAGTQERSAREQLEEALDNEVKKLVIETIDPDLIQAFVVEEVERVR